jgi:hypothetical protein
MTVRVSSDDHDDARNARASSARATDPTRWEDGGDLLAIPDIRPGRQARPWQSPPAD